MNGRNDARNVQDCRSCVSLPRSGRSSGVTFESPCECLAAGKGGISLPESETAIQVGIRFLERLCNPVPIVSDVTSLSSQTYPQADPAKQEGILRGASDLLRQLSAIKSESEVPDVDFVKYL